MAIDTPSRIAVLGAGPIGLEVALYARCLGYNVDVYERGRVCENVLRWGHVTMFSPFGMNRSSLGLAALVAQDEAFSAPNDEAILTGRQWVDSYLLPLSKTDLIADHIHENTTVVAVGRRGLLKSDILPDRGRGDVPFCLLLCDGQGRERIASAEVVVDTTGVYANPNWMGQGGIPAVGESQLRDQIEYGLPDILGADRAHYAGQHTLLVGAGHSAATTVVALAQLAREADGTKVTWITRPSVRDVVEQGSEWDETHADGDEDVIDEADGGLIGNDRALLATGEIIHSQLRPIAVIENDRLSQRARLSEAANRLAAGGDASVTFLQGNAISAIHRDNPDGPFTVELVGSSPGSYTFDRVVANVGGRPDALLYRELQVHECYATEGPIKLAAALLDGRSADCLDVPTGGAELLINPEPNFYLLGAKSYGRSSQFLYSAGLDQVRNLFTIIGDREGLDLYGQTRGVPA